MTLRGGLRGGEGRDKQQVGRELLPVRERAKNAMLADVLPPTNGVIEKASQSNRLSAFCEPNEGLRNDQAAATTSEHYNGLQSASPVKSVVSSTKQGPLSNGSTDQNEPSLLRTKISARLSSCAFS
jgi:hypothetical protein